MELTIIQNRPGCADGIYRAAAPGAASAMLYWADEKGLLEGWQSFAAFPLDERGAGEYIFTGGRAVPEEAGFAAARFFDRDGAGIGEAYAAVDAGHMPREEEASQRFLVMTDLHLVKKPWRVRRALLKGEGYDGVLISGDITNDGTQPQLELFYRAVEELLPGRPVLTVSGNHDYPRQPLPQIREGICDYPALQNRLLDRLRALGRPCREDDSGAWRAGLGDTEILGLNAVTHGRLFRFPEGAQVTWLRETLKTSRARQTIILCHAPLRRYQPGYHEGIQPYLNRDKELEQILLECDRRVIWISGHTHLSLCCAQGCLQRDASGHFHISAGSLCPTDLKADGALQPPQYREGNMLELTVGETGITVTGISAENGERIARGHYRFLWEPCQGVPLKC